MMFSPEEKAFVQGVIDLIRAAGGLVEERVSLARREWAQRLMTVQAILTPF